jgi:HEAT repeat protein
MPINIRKIIEKISDEDPVVRKRAAEALAEGDERAVYPLVKALGDDNPGVQDAAMRSLIAIGGEVVAYMVTPLLRETTLIRNTALIILRDLGEVSVQMLYALLRDKDDDMRKFAIDLFGEIKEGVDPRVVVPMLKDPNANVRAAAAKALGLLGYKEAVPDIVNALADEEWVCFSALEALGEMDAKEAAKDIAGLLSNPSLAVRYAAIETLGRLGSEAIVEDLKAYLPKAQEEEKNAVIKSLIQIGITPDMSDLSVHLLEMLKNGDWDDKEVALKGIASLNCREAVPLIIDMAGFLDPSLPENEERISLLKDVISRIDSEEELLKILQDPDSKYRGKSFAIELLGEIRSSKAINKLIGYLGDDRRDLRRASADALGEIGDSDAIEYLLETSRSDIDAHVRRAAIEALGNIRAKESFVALMNLLDNERYYDIVEKIVEALIKIDSVTFLSGVLRYKEPVREVIAKVVMDVGILIKLSDDSNKKVKIAAIYGLGRIANDDAMTKLVEFLGDVDPDIRKAAVVALGETHYCPPELFNSLHDDDPWVRFYTIKAITFSCDREKAIEMISGMLNDDFIPVVMSAIDAIRDIGGQEAYEALMAHREHSNPDVQEKIQEALNSI